jgi:hypothetical protein
LALGFRGATYQLSDAAVAKIIAEAGTGLALDGRDREMLRNELMGCLTWWQTLERLGTVKAARSHVQRVKKIARTARDLRNSFDDETMNRIGASFPLYAGEPGANPHPNPAPSFSTFLAGLDLLIEAANQRAAAAPTHAVLRLPRSTIGHLAGKMLPKIFKKHFRRKAAIARSSQKGDASIVKTGGPYIRFACAALRELGITNEGKPYSPDTIATALQDVRGKRQRRKVHGRRVRPSIRHQVKQPL